MLGQIGGKPFYSMRPTMISSPFSQEGMTASEPALRYALCGPRSGNSPRHTVVLSHALGCDLSMWNALADTLAEECRVIAYDHRGHGKSEVPAEPYSMEELADDAARIIREAQADPVVWIGISMGGMVGQELALRHPELVSALVLANCTSRYPEEAQTAWQQRIVTVEQQGVPGIIEATLQRFFSPAFHEKDPKTVDAFRRRLLSTELQGYLGCCYAVRDINTTGRLPQIAVPVQIIASEYDQGTPADMAKIMAEHIPYARLAILPDAAHLSAIEQPDAFSRIVASFLREL
jgi:3-oxoadipate enol-lactonase